MRNQPIQSSSPTFLSSVFPIFVLIILLAINIFYTNGSLLGDYTNQYILIIASIFASVVGLLHNVPFSLMIKSIFENLKSIWNPILILFLVGALAGTWLVSGTIPTMVYYGLEILNAKIFLPASVIIAALISVVTGSSWTTSATVGIALIGIGSALGFNSPVVAGAVISGSYFGDKISPLSDTTNLASAIAEVELFSHIRYMSLTTIPSLIVTLIVFSIIGLNTQTTGTTNIYDLQNTISQMFQITPWLSVIPLIVIGLILLKIKPLLSLSLGIIFACYFAFIFQSDLLYQLYESRFKTILYAIFSTIEISTSNKILAELFTSGGMQGMIWTVLLIVSAMIFGGVMEAIGALSIITQKLLTITKSTFGLFLSTVGGCIGLNIVASDQYLAIVISGKMFKNAFKEQKLAPENLSRTLEDTGTVTSVLIPWNTCGAYETAVLGVHTSDYFIYAVFNYVSPIMTLIFAAFKIKIRRLNQYLSNNWQDLGTLKK